MESAIGVVVLAGIVGGIGSMLTVAVAETRGLIHGDGESAAWFFFGFLIPVIAPIVALLMPRRTPAGERVEARNGTGSPRTLAPDERAVLIGVLNHEDFPGREALLAQVDHTLVEGSCPCGCASLHLIVRGAQAAPAVCPSPLPTEAVVVDDAGHRVGGLIVFVHDGFLSYLEIYSRTAHRMVGASPPVRMVRFRSAAKEQRSPTAAGSPPVGAGTRS